MIDWHNCNWFGKVLITIHDILVGPDEDFSDWEYNLIMSWGSK